MTQNQNKTWIVISNSNTCRLYEFNKKPIHLKLVKEFYHPENKLKDIEITSDKPGRYESSGSHGAFEQKTDPKEILIDNFSREVMEELDKARTIHAYGKLIIIAPPHINGLFFHHMNSHVKDLVTHNIKKDMMHFDEAELSDFLQQQV